MLLKDFELYAAKRRTSGALPGGIAPRVSSTSFTAKTPMTTRHSKRWDHKLSVEACKRSQSTLKAASQVQDPSAIISLGTGRPAARYYPWQSVTVEASDANRLSGVHQAPLMPSLCSKGEDAYDLGLVLNYGYAAGSPQLLRFVTEHVEAIHNPCYNDWETAITCGNTSAAEIVFRMLCDRGDWIITEALTYPGTIEATKGLGLGIVPIGMDQSGLLPDELDSVLSNWDDTKGCKPSLLYIIPSGQNPTGATQSVERRKAIYEVAEKHDLLILEDDPYYFIRLDVSSDVDSSLTSCEYYLQDLPPSYLSLDTSGRVLRLDSTSKILSPGLRCGWITGCSQLIQKFIDHTEMSTLAPSGPSQALLYKLLDECWGHVGFINWLSHLSLQFQEKMDTLVDACHRFLPKGLCQWRTPSAGMFLWIQVDFTKHPAARQHESFTNVHDLALFVEDKIYISAREHGVVISKGSWFAPCCDDVKSVHLRLTFVAVDDNELLKAVKRLAGALHQEFYPTLV